jgi:hypothetical protein
MSAWNRYEIIEAEKEFYLKYNVPLRTIKYQIDTSMGSMSIPYGMPIYIRTMADLEYPAIGYLENQSDIFPCNSYILNQEMMMITIDVDTQLMHLRTTYPDFTTEMFNVLIHQSGLEGYYSPRTKSIWLRHPRLRLKLKQSYKCHCH